MSISSFAYFLSKRGSRPTPAGALKGRLARQDAGAGFAAGDQGDGKKDHRGDGPERGSATVRIRCRNQRRDDGTSQEPAVEEEAEEERPGGSRIAGLRAEHHEGEQAGARQGEADESAANPEPQPARMIAHPQDDGRPAAGHE